MIFTHMLTDTCKSQLTPIPAQFETISFFAQNSHSLNRAITRTARHSFSYPMAEQRDLIAELCGHFGKWQLRALLIIFLCKIPTSWFMAVILYSSPVPHDGEFWCKPPVHLADHLPSQRAETMHPSIEHNGQPKVDVCLVYREIYALTDGSNGTVTTRDDTNATPDDVVPCAEFVFSVNVSSVVAAYGLVCGRKFLGALAQCFHIGGLLIGGVLAFYLLPMYVCV